MTCTGIYALKASAITPARLVAVEFTGDDPRPGAEALIERAVPRRDRPQQASLALRWMYGHGFNRGRIFVEARVDGQRVFRTDVAEPTRWQTVAFEIPRGPGLSSVSLIVIAGERIEAGWKWGRSSTVLAKDFVVAVQ